MLFQLLIINLDNFIIMRGKVTIKCWYVETNTVGKRRAHIASYRLKGDHVLPWCSHVQQGLSCNGSQWMWLRLD